VLVLLYGIPVAASHERPLFSFETSARPGDNRRQWKTTDDMVWLRRSLGRLRNGSLIDIFVDGPLGLRSPSFKVQITISGAMAAVTAAPPPPLSWRHWQRRLKLTQTEAPLDPLERIFGVLLIQWAVVVAATAVAEITMLPVGGYINTQRVFFDAVYRFGRLAHISGLYGVL